jgi:hypothetical protein
MKGNGGLPILVAGGGIGGLATAYALSRKGFPVRVLEQAPGKFRELGAGIQTTVTEARESVIWRNATPKPLRAGGIQDGAPFLLLRRGFLLPPSAILPLSGKCLPDIGL